VDRNSDDDELSSDDEFVQRDEDDVVLTTRLARQGGVGGAQMKVTARNLRIREDTAKYLYNLNVNSAYYDPKSRSMRDNPFGEMKSDNTDYAGDNFVRISGDAVALAQQQLFAWDAAAKLGDDTTGGSTGSANHELHPIANPSQMEILQKTFSSKQDEIRTTMKRNILDKYGGAEYLDGTDGLAAAAPKTTTPTITNVTTIPEGQVVPPLDHKLRFGVSTQVEEYTRDGRLLASNKNNKADSKKSVALESKYEENVFINGHTTVWGSYFHKGAFTWGYDDDHSLLKNSYCTGRNGRMANDEANAMQYGTGQAGSATLEQVRRQMLPPSQQRSTTEQQQRVMNRSKLYGEVDPTLPLDEQKVQEALRQGKKRDDGATSDAHDSRWNKRKKYNSNDAEEEMTPEMMEAYRIQKVNSANDPMAKYLSG
jgi:pre-mRNA-processing factor SLU7